MQLFNKALLFKWIWRFLTEKESLWTRVIRSRHGSPPWLQGRHVSAGKGRKVGWWKKISSLVEGDEGVWFWERMRQRIGDGREVRFWDGAWSGERTLKELFPRLFHLSTKKEGMVNEMGNGGKADGFGSWNGVEIYLIEKARR